MLENLSMLASRGIHSGALVVMGWVRLGCEIERVARWHQAVAPCHGSASVQRSPTVVSGIGRRPFRRRLLRPKLGLTRVVAGFQG